MGNANGPVARTVPPGPWGGDAELLLDLLGGVGSSVILGRLAVGGGDAEGLLQEFAGLQAVGADVAPGLHGDRALRRDGHLPIRTTPIRIPGLELIAGLYPVQSRKHGGMWIERCEGVFGVSPVAHHFPNFWL